MFHRYLIVPFLITYSSNAFCAESNKTPKYKLEELDDSLTVDILEFLDPQSLKSVVTTSKYFGNFLSANEDTGTYLRDQMFKVITQNDEHLPLGEYLEGERIPVKNIRNIAPLMKESSSSFLRFIYKSIPYTTETIKADLKTYYFDLANIKNLIATLAPSETPQQKIASLFIEISIWDQAWYQVKNLMMDNFRDQSWNQVMEQVLDHVWTQVGAQVGAQVVGQIGAEVWDEIRGQDWDQKIGRAHV